MPIERWERTTLLGLSTLIFMIVAGVTIAILATHLAGGSNRPQLEGDAQTASIFHRDFPETAIGPIIYPKDRRTAFFLLQEGRVGVVHGIGNRFLTRQISPSDIVSAEAVGATDLKLRFRDFTWPAAEFSFADETGRNTVCNWFAGGRLQ